MGPGILSSVYAVGVLVVCDRWPRDGQGHGAREGACGVTTEPGGEGRGRRSATVFSFVHLGDEAVSAGLARDSPRPGRAPREEGPVKCTAGPTRRGRGEPVNESEKTQPEALVNRPYNVGDR